MIKFGLLALSALALSACVTPRYKEFGGVKEGMEKDLVLEQAGGPNVTRRSHGKDRWLYNYTSSPNGPQTKEIQFENGRAVYVGSKVAPKVSADQQDRINEQSNAQVTARDEAEIKRWNQEHGVATSLKTGDQLDRYDRRIQESMYGTSLDPKVERQKVAPQYESLD